MVILEDNDFREREALIWEFDKRIEENQESGDVVVSNGIAIFDPASDTCFSTVFERADKKMYKQKRYLKAMKSK